MKTALLDIMGTMVHNRFIKELMGYFAGNSEAYIQKAPAEALEVIDEIKRGTGLETPEQIATHVATEVKQRNFNPNYMFLMGLINEQGYQSGELTAPFFEDVSQALQRFGDAGIGRVVYSQGSPQEQATIFRHSDMGDLTHLVNRYIGTDGVGPKKDPTSYERISDTLRTSPSDITFFSDLTEELDAADKAGLGVVLVNRPGNKEQPANNYKAIESFELITL